MAVLYNPIDVLKIRTRESSIKCAKTEVQTIIDNTEIYVTYLQLQYKDFEFSTLEFWQGVLDEIK